METEGLIAGKELVPVQTAIPGTAIITSVGDDAVTQLVEYFTAHISHAKTRGAYFRNAIDFLCWCEDCGIHDLKAIKPVIVATYIEQIQQEYAKRSVKQHLATIRMLFDWLVTGHVIDVNPAHAVSGPKHIISKGKPPLLTAEETHILLDSIPVERVTKIDPEGKYIKGPDLIGLRDRAIIAAMVYTFGRVGAIVAMTRTDYYTQGKRSWLRLHEKGGKQHEMPAHHTLAGCIDAYLQAAGIADDEKGPLFRTAPGTGTKLTRNRMPTADVLRMIRRRIKQARTKVGCHSFRATGITCYLEARAP